MKEWLNELKNCLSAWELESGIRVVYTKGNTHIMETTNYYIGIWVSRTKMGFTRRFQLFSKSEYTIERVLLYIREAKGLTSEHYTKFNINLKKYNRRLARKLHERHRRLIENSV